MILLYFKKFPTPVDENMLFGESFLGKSILDIFLSIFENLKYFMGKTRVDCIIENYGLVTEKIIFNLLR
jgi:hypothetical protein